MRLLEDILKQFQLGSVILGSSGVLFQLDGGGLNADSTSLALSTTTLATGGTAWGTWRRGSVEGRRGRDWDWGRGGGNGPDGQGHIGNWVIVTCEK